MKHKGKLIENNSFNGYGEPEFNACNLHDKDPSIFCISNYYFESALYLLNKACDQKDLDKTIDLMWMPILFQLRHGFETFLKEIQMLTGEKVKPTHDLKKLLKSTEPVIRNNICYMKIFNMIKGFILDLHQLDPNGESFRYVENNKGKKNLKDFPVVNLKNLLINFKSIYGLIKHFESMMEHDLFYGKNQKDEDYDLLRAMVCEYLAEEHFLSKLEVLIVRWLEENPKYMTKDHCRSCIIYMKDLIQSVNNQSIKKRQPIEEIFEFKEMCFFCFLFMFFKDQDNNNISMIRNFGHYFIRSNETCVRQRFINFYKKQNFIENIILSLSLLKAFKALQKSLDVVKRQRPQLYNRIVRNPKFLVKADRYTESMTTNKMVKDRIKVVLHLSHILKKYQNH